MPRTYAEARNRVFHKRHQPADRHRIETLSNALDLRPTSRGELRIHERNPNI